MARLVHPGPTPAATLVHDMRNCLFALQSAAQLLPLVRNDDEQFTRVHEAMGRQVTELRELIAKADEMLKVADAREAKSPSQ